jgi:hypothetical protein
MMLRKTRHCEERSDEAIPQPPEIPFTLAGI